MKVVVDLLRQEDGTGDPDWVEGLVSRASVYPAWSLRRLPTHQLHLDCTDAETARAYSVGIEGAPPIVAIPGSRGKYEILDGGHRALAADMVRKPVLAYVPQLQGSRSLVSLGPVDMLAPVEREGWRFDPRSGLGSVPLNGSVDYHGFVVSLSPREFLSLTPPRGLVPREGMVEAMRMEGIGPPFLDVRWEGGGLQVVGHEGRGRSMALDRHGFQGKMPVHVFFRDGTRARHLDAEALAKASLISQRGAAPFRLPVSGFVLRGTSYESS